MYLVNSYWYYLSTLVHLFYFYLFVFFGVFFIIIIIIIIIINSSFSHAIVQLCIFITHALAKNLVPYGYWNSYSVKPFSCAFFVRYVSEGVKNWLWLACFYVSMATLFGNMEFIYKTYILHSTDSVICFYLST